MKKNRCILVKYSPYLKWIDDDLNQTEQSLNSNDSYPVNNVSIHESNENHAGDIKTE